MTSTGKKNERTLNALAFPLIGTVIFVLDYLVAAIQYGGGSQAFPHATRFSWRHNYWCNLLAETSINGTPNPGVVAAMAGMLVLAATMICFWMVVPGQLSISNRVRSLVRITGVLSMLTGLLLFSGVHDTATMIASGLGVIASAGLLAGLYRSGLLIAFWMGMANLALVMLNNYFYYNPALIGLLPVLQKLTFGSFLFWICRICWSLMVRQIRKKDQ
ncbi:MAG: hypothetical protein EOO09_02400 [Chitinophagaceae bacterium]|nr:MAG: hypothetical protein EOO09_02400 [Chitinophagaceae bacterium]